ncbi:dissimilatory-type sulfite reductase subunit alpha [Desulfobulbus sp. US1]|uniref:Hydrogensulfite reductase alpha subunit n=4 Tax=Candidatus Electrothrix communis TaxID=1859133 RepID=A0A192W418_9BACT|nr:hydrogensulfite reductase alpha subunit [Candidatus Electrothrix communis]MCW5201445.1 dissimilatory-type sulfite reductase subunit alpha [Desulfobulbus sp. US4]MCW5208661.1 dissimilatory-type sulfite reductase subunit alpha [Desulfobulbus sp. US1]MCW5213916.1 dissimilatory-type sulfite reductase subunit alpha [Desulfobulbus sp. US5]AMR60637.1 hydrogensulfite reductase alpha subunit [Candidatus Electrothrix communis]
MAKHDTPLLDDLEKGPWPSFVTDMKRQAETHPECWDILGQLELSFKDRITHWKHGGIVGVFGYGGGIVGRYSDVPKQFPGVEHFHTVRIAQPAGLYYSTKNLRALMDLWDKYGSGMTNMHGSTGDMIFLGTRTENLEPLFWDLTHDLDQDLGGSGSNLRTPSCCLGDSRCEWACYDAQDVCYHLTMHYQDEIHRPAFPYKFKFKFSGCSNDCVASIARSDFALIGTWKDDIQMDQAAVKEYVAGNYPSNGGAHAGRDWGAFDIKKEVIDLCPTNCMWMEGDELKIDNSECTRCMHCINVMPRALKPGKEKGATVCIGAKAPILDGAQFATMVIPFIKVSKDNEYENVIDVIEQIWDWWMEVGKNRERVGETMQRIGLPTFLKVMEVEAMPQHVKEPRSNPYVFWKEEEVEGGWERDVQAFRKKHAA